MAARAILRRKTFIPEQARLAPNRQIRILDNVIERRIFHAIDDFRIYSIATRNNISLPGSSTALERCNVKRCFTPSLGMRSVFTRSEEEKGNSVRKKKENLSPDECDQALISLSNAKARAKAVKQLREQKLFYESVRLRISAAFLRIGPALKAVIFMSKEDWAKKLLDWKRGFISTVHHYKSGCKLLYRDIKICRVLLLKHLRREKLSRAEIKQLKRTAKDLLKLGPLLVSLIVPAGEFVYVLIVLKLPSIVPSRFQHKDEHERAEKRILNTRIEWAKFLQETALEMAEEVQRSRVGEVKRAAKDFDEFLNRIRKGARVSNEEILSFAKLFNDELTLDKMCRARLVSMCKYMDMSPYGTNAYLRNMLRNRLRRIKEDDISIQSEGVESLSEDDLREDCRSRGILGLDSVEKMRQELRNWLDLSLNHSVSSSLLILSRAFIVSGNSRLEEAIKATISSLPDDIVANEEEIEEARLSREDDVALNEMSVPVTTTRTWEKQEQLCELSRALAVLASSSSVSVEREEFLRLVHEEIRIYNEMVLNDVLNDDPRESMASQEECEKDNKVVEVSSALLERVDSMLKDLEKELDEVDTKIGDSHQLLDKDFDGKVTAEEVTSATKYLKNTLVENEGITLQDLITTLSKDQEGKILVEDIIKMGTWNGYSNNNAPDLRI